jgi:hypothetical protein
MDQQIVEMLASRMDRLEEKVDRNYGLLVEQKADVATLRQKAARRAAMIGAAVAAGVSAGIGFLLRKAGV